MIFNGQTLDEYFDWFMEHGAPLPMTPVVDGFRNTPYLYSLVLHRAGQFQTQMFILKGKTIIPVHTHPNIDIYELYIAGDFQLFLGGVKCELEQRSALHRNTARRHQLPWQWGRRVRIPPSLPHHFEMHDENGGVFVSIQHWLDNEPPTSVELNWEGPKLTAVLEKDLSHV